VETKLFRDQLLVLDCFEFLFLLCFENNLFLWDCCQIRKQNFCDHIFVSLFANVCLTACSSLFFSFACVDGQGICEIQVQKPKKIKNEVLAVQK